MAPCRDEGRTIGVVAFHIAEGYRYALAVLDAAVSGQSYPAWVGRTPEEGEAINPRQADEHADVRVTRSTRCSWRTRAQSTRSCEA